MTDHFQTSRSQSRHFINNNSVRRLHRPQPKSRLLDLLNSLASSNSFFYSGVPSHEHSIILYLILIGYEPAKAESPDYPVIIVGPRWLPLKRVERLGRTSASTGALETNDDYLSKSSGARNPPWLASRLVLE